MIRLYMTTVRNGHQYEEGAYKFENVGRMLDWLRTQADETVLRLSVYADEELLVTIDTADLR
jgi:hypothetical protein